MDHINDAACEIRWISVAEAAQRTSTSAKFIRALISRGEIEAVRLGSRMIRVDASSLVTAGRSMAYNKAGK